MKKLLKKLLKLIITLGMLFLIGVWGLGYREYRQVISENPIENSIQNVKNKDLYSTYDEIPSLFLDAIVSVEDERFWVRNGTVDFEALIRATAVNIINLELVQGGSTIPQQVSKNLYFENSASLIRKVSEYFVTRDLLKVSSKQEILELYVNMIYYGNGAYSIKEASLNYFNIYPWQLNEGELVILAGLPQAPSIYDLTQNYDLAKQRQHHVLDRMVANGVLTEEQAHEIFIMEVRNYEKND